MKFFGGRWKVGQLAVYLETHSLLTASHSVNLLMGSPNYSNKGFLRVHAPLNVYHSSHDTYLRVGIWENERPVVSWSGKGKEVKAGRGGVKGREIGTLNRFSVEVVGCLPLDTDSFAYELRGRTGRCFIIVNGWAAFNFWLEGRDSTDCVYFGPGSPKRKPVLHTERYTSEAC